jgi:hypothetical protein
MLGIYGLANMVDTKMKRRNTHLTFTLNSYGHVFHKASWLVLRKNFGHQQLITYQLTPHTPCAYEQPLETLPHNRLNSPTFIALFRNPMTQMVCKSSSIWDCNENLKKINFSFELFPVNLFLFPWKINEDENHKLFPNHGLLWCKRGSVSYCRKQFICFKFCPVTKPRSPTNKPIQEKGIMCLVHWYAANPSMFNDQIRWKPKIIQIMDEFTSALIPPKKKKKKEY